ncbi:MAG: tetratricopeptide repeat protein [Desulfovibrionales bacterium]
MSTSQKTGQFFQGLVLEDFEQNPSEKGNALQCAFSTQISLRIGTGATARKQTRTSYWYVVQNGADEFEVQQINAEHVPSGEKRIIDREKLFSEFHPEVEYYNTRVFPAMRKLQKTIARADRYRKRGEIFSAEMEYKNVLHIDPESVRATFGIGLIYLERGDKEKAGAVFNNLIRLDGAFEEEYKHLFNEFGISLRKNGLFKEAVDYYSRAMELTSGDDHLRFNLSRAFFECGDWKRCMVQLAHSMEKEQRFDEATQFCRYLLKLATSDLPCKQLKGRKLGEEMKGVNPEIIPLLQSTLNATGGARKKNARALQELLSR